MYSTGNEHRKDYFEQLSEAIDFAVKQNNIKNVRSVYLLEQIGAMGKYEIIGKIDEMDISLIEQKYTSSSQSIKDVDNEPDIADDY